MTQQQRDKLASLKTTICETYMAIEEIIIDLRQQSDESDDDDDELTADALDEVVSYLNSAEDILEESLQP